ncbi:MAG: HlyD family type I secretion periplasmic adaptor subunit [Burkholderiales bacterium]
MNTNDRQRVPSPGEMAQGQGEDQAAPVDNKTPLRIALWTIGIGFCALLLWSFYAPLDEGVPTQGMVAIDTKRKAVQHLTGGIVKQVLVKEGQFVRADEPLLLLDDAVARANYESARQHYLTLRAMEGRLLAEQSNQAKINFHPDLLSAGQDAYIRQTLLNQEQLLQSRRLALQAEVQAMAEAIVGNGASISGFEGILSARKSQLSSLEEDQKGMRDLVREGYAPRTKLLELDRMVAENMASMADAQGNSQRLRSSIAELKLRMVQKTQEYRKEVDTQLADVRREVQADAEKFKASGDELKRVSIRAPAAGQVVGMVVQNIGAVVTPGQKLMDIVPGDEALLLETKVAPHLIDRVQSGALADVRFSSFAHSPQLVVEGRITSISSDLLAEPNQPPYYLARVAITAEGLKLLGSRVLQPGMPVEVMIKTGERSVLTYLLHPLLKRMAAAMKEE